MHKKTQKNWYFVDFFDVCFHYFFYIFCLIFVFFSAFLCVKIPCFFCVFWTIFHTSWLLFLRAFITLFCAPAGLPRDSSNNTVGAFRFLTWFPDTFWLLFFIAFCCVFFPHFFALFCCFFCDFGGCFFRTFSTFFGCFELFLLLFFCSFFRQFWRVLLARVSARGEHGAIVRK